MENVDQDAEDGKTLPTPAELMRSWHPDLFSDTQRASVPAVPQPVLDHHLETLTNRKQENEFEYFARLLAERELCPNLRPQTGPTGGGDSKVDTETYLVAPEIAQRWYQGEPKAAGERWAFAFSAKKKWRDKVRSDVEKIVGTGRGYTSIYFVTNQYAPEKARAALEDELAAKAGVPVTILDRTWLLEKVYANGHLELAVRALGMTGYAHLLVETLGPQDTARQAELTRLDAAVADHTRYDGARYGLVEDSLQSALLARGLERPRSEVEGRFAMASRIADEVGHDPQRLRIAYNRAWTAYWWFNDPRDLSIHYDATAALALESENAADLELLLNLWQVVSTAVRTGRLSPEVGRVVERGKEIREALDRVIAQKDRPNNAAQARTLLLVMRASHAIQVGRAEKLEAIWNELRGVIEAVEGLGDYPVERIHELIARLGEHVPESLAFDALYDTLVSLLEKHRSEAEGGTAYMRRGLQKLEKGKHFDAIRMLGRAETRLVKAEYVDELVMTLLAIGQAYRDAGLVWAARAKALVAADRLLSAFATTGHLDPSAVVPLRFLVWCELKLGRVVQALAMVSLFRGVISHTDQSEALSEQHRETLWHQELVLGMLLMRCDLDQLRSLELLPDVLNGEELEMARGALLWALGGADAFRADGFAIEGQSDAEVEDFFKNWMDQPAAKDLPPRPIIADSAPVEFRSRILGVEIVAQVASHVDSILLVEAILAALECFLSTSLAADLFPYRERLFFTVAPSDDPGAAPTLTIDTLERTITITHGEGNFAGAPEYTHFIDWLQEILIKLTLQMVLIPDPRAWIESIAGDEAGFGRALGLGATAVATRNLFGPQPRLLLTDWIHPAATRYPVTRTSPFTREEEAVAEDRSPAAPIQFGSGEPPEPFDAEAAGHLGLSVISTIETPLWERAGWRGPGFTWAPGMPPSIHLIYTDLEAGQAIFRGWRERYGPVDERESLRISIIRGIDRTSPAAYAMMIGSDIGSEFRSGAVLGSVFALSSRIQRLYPADTANLDRFLAAYKDHGGYLLAPAALQLGPAGAEIDPDLVIAKQRLVVRDAWEVGEHDPDMSALDPDAEPVIPAGVVDPPVLAALTRLRAMAQPEAEPAER